MERTNQARVSQPANDIKNKKSEQNVRIFLWYLQESNQGHKDFQSFALPTELRYLCT